MSSYPPDHLPSSRVLRALFAVILTICFGHSAAAWSPGRTMVRIKPGRNGWAAIRAVCVVAGCQVVRALDTLPGEEAPSSLFLVEGLPAVSVTLQLDALGVQSLEADLPVAVASDEGWESAQASAAVLDQLGDRTPVDFHGTTAWRSYVSQPAAGIVRATDARCSLGVSGGGTVAVIDTGIDPGHPAFQGLLTDGWDFTRDVAGGSEMADVPQDMQVTFESVYAVNAATAATLDQASAAVLDDTAHKCFGHGTMVAGAVHLVVPATRIMPLKAFGADGTANTSDIVRAIVYAVRKGARVLNMSFSRSTPSGEVKRALDYASSHGAIAVSSTGNDGLDTTVYPAAYANVMGVASTANDDTRSSFSNYGASMVWVAAPGEAVITTYPFGAYAAAWGTSFSTPLVSGAASLLAGLDASAAQDQIAAAIAQAVPLTPDLGHGRLDVYEAVQNAVATWSTVTYPADREVCEYSVDWSQGPSEGPS